MGKDEQCTDFDSALQKLSNRINTNVLSIIHNPTHKKDNGNVEYTISPSCSIYRGRHRIVDIYDMSRCPEGKWNEEIIKVCRNTIHEGSNLYYLFFFNKNSWQGLHLFRSKMVSSNPKPILVNPHIDYIGNYHKRLWVTSIEDIISRITTSYETTIMENILSNLKTKIKEWFDFNQEAAFKDDVLKLIERWTNYSISCVTYSSFSLTPEEEDKLFLAVLGSKEYTKVYRYVGNSTLTRIVNEGTHAMSSIACMNDKTECYYASDYLLKESNNKEGLSPTKENKDIDNILNYDAFINSFSLCRPNELTMWRLYGDDTKGACIEYDITNTNLPSGFYIAPISYPQKNGKHIELEFIKFLCNELYDYHQLVLMRWYIWARFFKPLGFSVENEVRLLFCPLEIKRENIKWVFANGIFSPIYMFSLDKENKSYPIYPLKITNITLGSKFPAQDVNEVLIKIRLSELGLTIKVEKSTIDYYRINK